MTTVGAQPVKRVVIIVQENHTTDNYFRALAPWGANVATGWTLCPNPPPQPPFSAYYPAHDRHAYFQWLTKHTAEHSQFDTVADLPYYLYLAVTGAFLENHCAGFGTNSTPNHLLLIGGQSPTLTNPPRRSQPVWDMPSLPGIAEANGVSWGCYTPGGYPVKFYQQLQGSPNILPSSQFVSDAANGHLPSLVYLWHEGGKDEHPPSNITDGMDAVWESVAAVVQSGGWDETVFLLTWDDWGGFDDHVATPVTEYTPDNVQLAFGPRVPLLMFGGYVRTGIDSRWCSHVSIPKTALQLLGLPALGVPRLDNDRGLADLVDTRGNANPPPPAYGAQISLPNPPSATRKPNPLPPSPVAAPSPVGEVLLRTGANLPPPNDTPLPQQPNPPSN
jgi:Phosphoesterase family